MMLLRDNRGQWGIVALLVTVALIAIFAYLYWPTFLGGTTPSVGLQGHGVTNGGPPTPMERAQGVECANNLAQIRSAISMYSQTNGSAPRSIEDLSTSGVSGELTVCPVTKKPYSYDPAQGRVWCTTPGHEKF